jgi:hypothetical protein
MYSSDVNNITEIWKKCSNSVDIFYRHAMYNAYATEKGTDMVTAVQKAMLNAVEDDGDELAILLAVSLMAYDFSAVDYIVENYQDRFTDAELTAVKESRKKLEIELAMSEREYATLH